MKRGLLLVLISIVCVLGYGQGMKDRGTAPNGLTRKAAILDATAVVYFEEGFETFPPDDWTLDPASGTGAWTQDDGTSYGPGAAFEGAFAAMFNNYNYSTGTEGSIITAALDLSASSNPVLKFSWWNNDSETSPSIISVSTSTDGITYTEMDQIQTFGSGDTTWVEYQSFIDNTVTHIKLTAISDYGMKNTFVDHLIIEEGPSTPIATLNITAADFGALMVGSTSNPWGDAFTLTNTGIDVLTISNITSLDDTPFTSNFDTSVSLGMGESHAFGFTYAPLAPQHDSVVFEIETNGGTVQITLEGSGYILAEGLVEIGTDKLVDKSLPFEPALTFTYSQSIFLQQELNMADKQIEKVYYQFNGHSEFTDEIVIYMGHIVEESFTDWVPINKLTAVYSGPITTPNELGWVEIALDIPFVYNNEGNLIIAVDENTEGTHSYNDDFYSTATLDNKSIVYYGSENADPANPPAGNLYAYRPNIRLQFEDLAAIQYGTINGQVTEGGTGIPIEGAVITAGIFSDTTDANGNYLCNVAAGIYTLSIVADGYATFTQTDVEILANDTITVNPELAGFFTLLNEGFESGSCPPAGWTQYQMGEVNGWSVWDFEHSGQYSARYYGVTTGADDWLVSPQIRINGESELTFWSWMGEAGCSVHISTGSANPSDNEYTFVEEMPDEGWSWNKHHIDLSAYAGQDIYIAFRGEAAEEILDWTLDDVMVTDIYIAGKISGTVNLTEGNGDVSQTEISVGAETVNPDVNGHYVIATAPGTYAITATLEGYTTQTIMDVTVVAATTTDSIDFTLEPLPYNTPQNVSINIETGLFSWDMPALPANQQELVYDDGSPSWAVNELGKYFGNRLSPGAPCRVLSLKYFTYAQADTNHFDAIVVGWNGTTPSDAILFESHNILAANGNWTEVDLSEHNFQVDGDFVPCLQAWEPVGLMTDYGQNNGRAWDGYSQAWEPIQQTYFIRATVEYEDGRIADIGTEPSRELIHYNVFLDDMENPLATISWEDWVFDDLQTGMTYTAGVQAVYAGGVSEIVELPFTFEGHNSGIKGRITLNGGEGNVMETNVSAGGITVHPSVSGVYTIQLAPGTYTVTAELDGYESVSIYNVEVQDFIFTEGVDMELLTPLGLHNIDNESLEIYPNPARQLLNIDHATGSHISMYNSMGVLVSQIENAKTLHQMDVSNLPHGTYIVKVVKAQIVTTKLVKIGF